MKRIVPYDIFEGEIPNGLTEVQIDFLDKGTRKMGIRSIWMVNPQSGLVDVEGSFDCSNVKMESQPFMGIRFGTIDGNFDCSGCDLLSLEGAPVKVVGDFRFQSNKIISLEHSPRYVGGNFVCYDNLLKSLKGAPEKIGGWFFYDYTPYTQFEHWVNWNIWGWRQGLRRKPELFSTLFENPPQFVIEALKKNLKDLIDIYEDLRGLNPEIAKNLLPHMGADKETIEAILNVRDLGII